MTSWASPLSTADSRQLKNEIQKTYLGAHCVGKELVFNETKLLGN